MSNDLMSYLDAAVSGWGLLAMAVGLLVVHEIGYRLGRRHRDVMLEAQKSQADLVVPSLLGLVSLLLAFSFDIAQNRFDQRKTLVIDDANAIGTTYLRAKTLPAPYDEHVQGLLREYVGDRLREHGTADLAAVLDRSGTLHIELWAETTAVARANPDSEIVGEVHRCAQSHDRYPPGARHGGPISTHAEGDPGDAVRRVGARDRHGQP
jgi:hypothetical protein